MPPRLRIGDVVEIPTPRGFAYAQFINEHRPPPVYGPLIRVLDGLFDQRPARFTELVAGPDRLVVFFPLRAAVRLGIAHVVANEVVPPRHRRFPVFRSGNENPETGRVETWWLWDGKREWRPRRWKPEYDEFPRLMIVNDTALIAMSTGDEPPERGIADGTAAPVRHFLYFATPAAAEQLRARLASTPVDVYVRPAGDGGKWLAAACHSADVDTASVGKRLEQLAQELGGEYDGTETRIG